MNAAFTADLRVVQLASVLQLLESEGLDGTLRIQPDGELGLANGQVVRAAWGGLTGLDAVLSLMLVPQQAASFVPGPPADGRPVADLMALVIDGARLADDWENLAARVLAPAPGASFPQSLEPVALRLDGARIVEAAVLEAGAHVVHVLDPLLDHLQRGVLREVAPPRPQDRRSTVRAEAVAPPEAPAVDDGLGFYDLLDASRVAIRDRDYAAAVPLLERAVSLRPDDRLAQQNLRRIRQFMETRA